MNVATAKPRITLRPARAQDVKLLVRWGRQPHVIAATTDDPDAEIAFEGAAWADEIAGSSEVSFYLIAEAAGRPIGAMQVIDPHREPTHYWGEVAPNLRAMDIWIGEADALGQGYGSEMMRQAIDACFAVPEVGAILVDPLNSNTDSHRFYARLGFVPEGRRLFNNEDDCLVHRLTRADWAARR